MTLDNYFEKIDDELLHNTKPSTCLYELIETNALSKEPPFNLFHALQKTEQNPMHHPEGNVFIHTMQVVDYAAHFRNESINPRVFMWAALLHDIGKINTTQIRKGKITAYNHDSVGAELVKEFLTFFDLPDNFVQSVSTMVRWHMQPLFISKNMPYSNLSKMANEVSPAELGLFSLCDRLGRQPLSKEKQLEEHNHILFFLKESKKKIQTTEETIHINTVMACIDSHKVTI